MANVTLSPAFNTTTSFAPSMVDLWTLEMIVVFAVDNLLVAAAIVLHALGIFLLWKTKNRDLSNQNILLIHVSIVSILNTLLSGMAIIIKAQRRKFPPGYILCYFIAYMSYIINLVYIAVDRLLFVVLTLKYQKIVRPYMVYLALFLLWLLAVTYGIVMKYGGLINNFKYNKYATYVYNVTVLVFTTVAYFFIILKVLLSSRSVQSSSLQSKVKLRKYIVPFLIVFTFFLFNLLPHIIATHVPVSKQHFYLRLIGLIGINVLNNISDALIYILLQPKVRKRLHKYLRKSVILVISCCSLRKTVDSTMVCFKHRKTLKSGVKLETDIFQDAVPTVQTKSIFIIKKILDE